MLKIKFYCFVIFTLFFCSCRTNKEERTIKGNEYFPLKNNTLKVFLVDSVYHNSFYGKSDTVSFEMRENVTDVLVDNSLDTFYRIELSRYNDVKVRWEVFKVFTRRIKDYYAIENINNSDEIKLLFPISSYKTRGSSYSWNLNSLNNKEPTLIKYKTVFSNYNNGLNSYTDCVNTTLVNSEKGLVNNIREEVYAKNIGLVYRYIDSTDYLDITRKRNGYEVLIRLKN